jgi:hypothetical protein
MEKTEVLHINPTTAAYKLKGKQLLLILNRGSNCFCVTVFLTGQDLDYRA